MTRISDEEKGINLSQGMPDELPPKEILNELLNVIKIPEYHQYSYTYGDPELRRLIAERFNSQCNLGFDYKSEVTITCGASEAFMATCLALFQKGDEVIILEPFYENYCPGVIFAEAKPVFVPMEEPEWKINYSYLEECINEKTKAIIINNPNNPTGKNFTREELELFSSICEDYNLIAVIDEIYDKMVYDGVHINLASLDNMWERTITINGFSKSYDMTGWRVGYCIAASEFMQNIRKVHDFLTVCAPNPFQRALIKSFYLDSDYFKIFVNKYKKKRDFFCNSLKKCSFTFKTPNAAYYVMADFRKWNFKDDKKFANFLVKNSGVATVPGSAFFNKNDYGKNYVRFCYSRDMEILKDAIERIKMKLEGKR